MKNTLDELRIDYSEEKSEETINENLENNPERVEDIEVTSEHEAAGDDGADMITELQEALQKQQELELQVKSLQEKLSVCYTKESRYSDKLSKLNLKASSLEDENKRLFEQVKELSESTTNLQSVNDTLTASMNDLTESSEAKSKQIQELTENLNEYRTRYLAVKKQLTESKSSKTTLDESLSSKNAEVTKLTEAISQLKESSEKKIQEALATTKNLEAKNSKLVEELQEAQKDARIVKSQSNAKLEQTQRLVEKYKSIAKTAVDKYIMSQATKIGVSISDVKSRLTESYSFKDIDKAIEDLQQYKLNINSLPFSTLADKKPVKMKIRESKEPLLDIRDNTSYNIDDDIDATLLTFTNQ